MKASLAKKRIALLLFAFTPFVACGGDDDSSAAPCVAGASEACACGDVQGNKVCDASGAFGPCSCEAGACNNDGVLDPGEACDGMDFGSESCGTQTMNLSPVGTLSCSSCFILTTGCTAASSGGTAGTSTVPPPPPPVGGTTGVGGTVAAGGTGP